MAGRARLAASLIAFATLAGCAGAPPAKPLEAAPAAARATKPAGRSVEDVMRTVGPRAERRLRARFEAKGVPYPPKRVHLLAFKQELQLELWVTGRGGRKHVATYPLTADSGELGPKLREGDYQIPEGIYRVSWLNPNSAYHLSMKLDYPNSFDRARAKEDGRTRLGGDIFIHGGDASIGCLAVGDPAVEELFTLAARIGIENVTTVIAPWDLRRRPAPRVDRSRIPWLPGLYARLTHVLAAFR